MTKLVFVKNPEELQKKYDEYKHSNCLNFVSGLGLQRSVTLKEILDLAKMSYFGELKE